MPSIRAPKCGRAKGIHRRGVVQWCVDRGLMNAASREERLRALMCAGLDGDADAHRELLLELSSLLRGYFRSRLLRFHRGPVEAEDLVQEVLMAVHTRRDTYDRSQLLTPWVHAIAGYKFVDYLRRTKESVKDAPADDAAHLTARNDFDSVESGHDLETLLAQLRPKARRAIRYVKLQGLSVREAAARTGMSESAVKVSVHRGLKALSALVKKGGRP
jgi:RNA polymerase sigma-70 factor (ECF subfamily)